MQGGYLPPPNFPFHQGGFDHPGMMGGHMQPVVDTQMIMMM